MFARFAEIFQNVAQIFVGIFFRKSEKQSEFWKSRSAEFCRNSPNFASELLWSWNFVQKSEVQKMRKLELCRNSKSDCVRWYSRERTLSIYVFILFEKPILSEESALLFNSISHYHRKAFSVTVIFLATIGWFRTNPTSVRIPMHKALRCGPDHVRLHVDPRGVGNLRGEASWLSSSQPLLA